MGDTITFAYSFPDGNAGLNAWVGIYPATSDPSALPSGSLEWNYVCSSSHSSSCTGSGHQDSGTMTIQATADLLGSSSTFPLELKAFLFEDGSDPSPYLSIASSASFTVIVDSGDNSCGLDSSPIAVCASKTSYEVGEEIVIDFKYTNNAGNDAWISLWPVEDSDTLPTPSPYWV